MSRSAAVVLALSLCLLCCGTQNKGDKGDEPAAQPTSSDTSTVPVAAALLVPNKAALPSCGDSNKNLLYYVQAELKFFLCDGLSYQELKSTTVPGERGETGTAGPQGATGPQGSPPTLLGTRLTHSATQTIASGTSTTVLTFTTEIFDSQDFHSATTNTSRITVPTGAAGYYLISANVAFATNSTGTRALALRKNGAANLATATVQGPADASNPTTLLVQEVQYLNAGDFYEVTVAQSSGVALNILAPGDGTPSFTLVRIGL